MNGAAEVTVWGTMSVANCWLNCRAISQPLPMGYANNNSDQGWILGRGTGTLTSVFEQRVGVVGYDAYVTYCGRRAEEWAVEASLDGASWNEVHRSNYDNGSSCGWFRRRW